MYSCFNHVVSHSKKTQTLLQWKASHRKQKPSSSLLTLLPNNVTDASTCRGLASLMIHVIAKWMNARSQPIQILDSIVIPAKGVRTGCPDTPSDGFVSRGQRDRYKSVGLLLGIASLPSPLCEGLYIQFQKLCSPL